MRHGIGVHHAGHAPPLPAAGRDPRAGRAAQGHLRHRHPRRRHQRADPHRAVHGAGQVRRHAHPRAQGPRVPPDRRAARAGRATTPSARSSREAPDHEVENARLLARAGDDEKKRRRIVRKKAPEGFVDWSDTSFEKLQLAQPEPLTSHFSVTHAMLLNVISRPGNAFAAMRHLLEDNHEPRARQRRHILRAIAIYRALRDGGRRRGAARSRTPRAGVVRIVGDLQLDFALNQPLSPFALAVIELLDRASPDLRAGRALRRRGDPRRPPPRAVRAAEQGQGRGRRRDEGRGHRVRGADGAAGGRDAGRKPLDELLDGRARRPTGAAQPWVEDARLSPKSVARDMFERAMTFVEYIGFYQLARSEGLVLRYLADTYRALRQTVPDEAKTEELADVVEPGWASWCARSTRQPARRVGESSRRARTAVDSAPPPLDDVPDAVTRNIRAFRVLVRNALVPPGGAGGAAAVGPARRAGRRGGLGRRAPGATRWSPTSPSTATRSRRSAPAPPPAAPAADDHRGAASAGSSGRSSTTPRATATGRSPPRSTSPRPTRRASRSSG